MQNTGSCLFDYSSQDHAAAARDEITVIVWSQALLLLLLQVNYHWIRAEFSCHCQTWLFIKISASSFHPNCKPWWHVRFICTNHRSIHPNIDSSYCFDHQSLMWLFRDNRSYNRNRSDERRSDNRSDNLTNPNLITNLAPNST